MRKTRPSRRYTYEAIFITLVTLVGAINCQDVRAAIYPDASVPYILVESGFSSRVSWHENQAHYIVAWDTDKVCLGLIPKQDITDKGTFSFAMQQEFDLSPDYKDISSPSIMLLDNGTILLLVKMRREFLAFTGFYFSRSNDNGTTWSTPVLLTTLNEKQVKNNHLLRVNSTHIVSFWEENNGVNTNVNNSVVYKISSDFGTTWSEKQTLFENCTRLFSAVQHYDGEMLLSMIFEHEYVSGIKPFFPYYLRLTGVEENWQDVSANLVNNTLGTEIPFFTYRFENDIMMVAYSSSIMVTNLSSGMTSDSFNVVDDQNCNIVGLNAIDNETSLCFLKNGTQCLLVYLDVSFERLFLQPGLPPEIIITIIIVILVGVQVGIYLIYVLFKKRVKKGKNSIEDGERKRKTNVPDKQTNEENGKVTQDTNKEKGNASNNAKKGRRDI